MNASNEKRRQYDLQRKGKRRQYELNRKKNKYKRAKRKKRKNELAMNKKRKCSEENAKHNTEKEQRVVDEPVDELKEEIYFFQHINNDDDPSDPSSNGDSGLEDLSSHSDPSWVDAEGFQDLEDENIGAGFIAIENLEDELNDDIREEVGDPGDMFTPCSYCGALKLNPILYPVRSPGELSLKSMCCQKGKIDVGDQSDPSPIAECILNMWSRDDDRGYVFRKYSRKINNAFSLVSFCAKEQFPGAYNPSYKVRGKAYMMMGALLPGEEQENPAYSQIYIYDADDDVQRVEVRLGYLKLGSDVPQSERQILRDLFVDLQKWITDCNPYVQQFKLALDMDVEENLNLVFHPEVPTGCHSRVYNAPTHELCVCATDDIRTTYPPIILRRNTTYLENNPTVPELQSIHDCHPLYDIIRYIFFFPDGGGKRK